MESYKDWKEYALDTVTKALKTGNIEGNYSAIVAALALINVEWEDRHPSYYNTQFAVGALLLPETSHFLRVYAWRMVVNGLGGYWQWQSHNGGEFSVALALQHLDILSADECRDTSRFNVCETHSGCHYMMVRPELLARIVKKFSLPTTNLKIGGKTHLSAQEFRERERLNRSCFSVCIGSGGQERYEAALRSM